MSRREGKTEAPTQKKKADNRKKGQAARSQDLPLGSVCWQAHICSLRSGRVWLTT